MLEIQRNAEIVNAATMQEIKKETCGAETWQQGCTKSLKRDELIHNMQRYWNLCRRTSICNLYCSIEK